MVVKLDSLCPEVRLGYHDLPFISINLHASNNFGFIIFLVGNVKINTSDGIFFSVKGQHSPRKN